MTKDEAQTLLQQAHDAGANDSELSQISEDLAKKVNSASAISVPIDRATDHPITAAISAAANIVPGYPQAVAGVEQGLNALGVAPEGTPKTYEESLAREKDKLFALAHANPIANSVGKLTGSIVGGNALLGALGKVPFIGSALTAAPEANLLTKIIKSGAGGAALGAAQNPESGNLDDWNARLHNTELGGILGSGTTAAVEGLTPYIGDAGKWLYKQAFKNSDLAAEDINAQPMSDVLNKYGIWGTGKSIRKQTIDLIKKLGNKANGIVDEASQTSGPADLENVMAPANERLAEAMGVPNERQAAKAAQSALENKYAPFAPQEASQTSKIVQTGVDPMGSPIYENVTESTPGNPGLDLKNLNKNKKSLYKDIGDTAYKNRTGVPVNATPFETEIMKKEALGSKNEIERLVDAATPGAGEDLASTNSDLSPLLTKGAKQELRKMSKAGNPFGFSDLLTLGGAAAETHQPEAALKILLAKKLGYDLPKTELFKTGVGTLLQNYSKNPGSTTQLGLRQLLMNYLNNQGAK